MTGFSEEKSPKYWCRRDESNTRPSHYEFSPAGKSEIYRNNSDRKSLSLLKFPHSAVQVGATQPPAKRSMSVPELCRADQRAVPAKSRGPPVPAATRDKARHSSFACFGAAKRDSGLISPRQIFQSICPLKEASSLEKTPLLFCPLVIALCRRLSPRDPFSSHRHDSPRWPTQHAIQQIKGA